MWERYCRGVQAIVFVVDAADHDGVEAARRELHDLLTRPSLAGIPLLVLGNKNDLVDALTTGELTERLDLKVRGLGTGGKLTWGRGFGALCCGAMVKAAAVLTGAVWKQRLWRQENGARQGFHAFLVVQVGTC